MAEKSKTVIVNWGGKAENIYDSGFMHMLKKHPRGGVSLFNMDLIENDAPGSGFSEKGVCSDTIWAGNRARKILFIEDPRAEDAWLVIFVYSGWSTPDDQKHPLKFEVNGHQSQIESWDISKCHLQYRWVKFPVEWLKKGQNIIELYCREAKSQEQGWKLYLARADEFEEGGGDPTNVGKTSFKSLDDGKTWKQSPFGADEKTKAEYSIRISLDRYVKTGWLASGVIDLWRGESKDFILPKCEIKKVKINLTSEVPKETSVKYYYRTGPEPSPFSKFWSAYELLDTKPVSEIELNDKNIDKRFFQFKAVLSTTNPLQTPILKSAKISVELYQQTPCHKNLKIAKIQNSPIKYSSINIEWEPWDRPEFKELRKRENLDSIIAETKTQFESISKLLEYATNRGKFSAPPVPEYPSWDTLSILDRAESQKHFGMCAQFNNFISGLCTAYGWQGRLINIMNHEISEVWSDDFGKWVYLDASVINHYYCDIKTNEPMSTLELHNTYLDYFFPNRSIDWMNDSTQRDNLIKIVENRNDKLPVKYISSTKSEKKWYEHYGFADAAFMRMVPRNNWYEKPLPRPLSHGWAWWPWNGYVNFYDERTPLQRQHSWYTDRPRDMWPDINLVYVHAISKPADNSLELLFETYTPNFSHFETNENKTTYKKVEGNKWSWNLNKGKNTLWVRAVNKLEVKGKPSLFEIILE